MEEEFNGGFSGDGETCAGGVGTCAFGAGSRAGGASVVSANDAGEFGAEVAGESNVRLVGAFKSELVLRPPALLVLEGDGV